MTGRMIRLDIPIASFCVFFWMIGGVCSGSERPPNVLFILTDDQSYETIRAFGHTDIDTPHLDGLVARGTTFTHCYNMGGWGGAICVSSRTMLVTGRSLWRSLARYQATDQERIGGRLWPQLMATRGYETYFTGKWHVHTDAEKVFHKTGTIRAGMPGDLRKHYQRPVEEEPDGWDPSDPGLSGYWEGGKHWSEVVGDECVEYLERGRNPTQPFFMYVGFNAPHDPRQSPKSSLDQYPLERMGLPENFLPEYPFKDAIGCSSGLRDENLAPFPRTPHAVKTHRREYYAIISHLDSQIGRILEALDRSGEADRTWIFFTSDHGLAVGHHGLFGKQNMYDHSLRVPFIVSGPSVPRGMRIDAPIYLQDVTPTVLELAGATLPDFIEFQSLLPSLAGDTNASRRDLTYGAYMSQQRAVIHEGRKLIVYPDVPISRLFDLRSDPQEQIDLSQNPSFAELKKSLLGKLQEEQRRLEDPLDLSPVLDRL